jgi:hypothetical protein
VREPVPVESAAPPTELGDGGGVEVDASAAGAGLDAELDGLAADALKGALDRQAAGAEVEVAPLETDDFASAHPGVGGEVQGRVEPLSPGGGQERGQLGCGPGSRGACAGAGESELGDVVVEQRSLDGEVERSTDDHVDLEHGLRCEPGPVPPASGGEVLVEPLEVVDP